MIDKAPMRLSAIIDLYYLEAISVAPSVTYGARNYRAFDKLKDDAVSNRDELAQALARAFFDYLWLIAFGEARHGKDCVIEGNYYPELNESQRILAYVKASHYDIKQNLPKLSALFGQSTWESNYGGHNWYKLCVAALNFYKWNNLMFADHVIDICHNGGMAFDKKETSAVINFVIDIQLSVLSTFLTFKRDEDILAHDPPICVARYISQRTKSLLERYFTLYNNGVVPHWLTLQAYMYDDTIRYWLRSEWPTYETIEWGNKVLSNPVWTAREDDDLDDSLWSFKDLENDHPARRLYKIYLAEVKTTKKESDNEVRIIS